jgi:rfaE bifunctional protein kinase chain/domain
MRRRAAFDRKRLHGIVDRFEGCRPGVLGDFVADEFVYGDIARISREAPVLILEHRQTLAVPGGGGNAVANLRALDATPVPFGIVGDDASGRRLVDYFRKIGVTVANVVRSEAYETPAKSRILAGGVHTRRQQIVRIDRGAAHGDLPRAVERRLAARLRTALAGLDGLLVADYGYGAATPRILRGALANGGRRRGIPVTVDSRSRVGRFRRVVACTPNQEELEISVERGPLRTDRAVLAAAQSLLERTGNRAVLVTRGARGMCLVERGREPTVLDAFGSGEVADVTGAGDTVIAAFSLAIMVGATLPEAAFISNLAAGLVVMKYGTATVSRDEVREAINEAVIP